MKKQSKKSKQPQKIDNLNETSTDDVISASTVESSFENSFFYTNDKSLNQLDNFEILQFIQHKFPAIDANSDDSVIKKNLVLMLDDDLFVQNVLKYFNLTIFDFFSILYKQFSTIFKGPYLKKLKNVVLGKKYANNERQLHDY